MNFRQFFTDQTWWGKLIGAFFGYLMAGPAGAMLGIFLGNIFDRGLTEHFTNPHWHYHAEKRQKVQTVFLQATFSVMGYLAKVDGRVSENEIIMAKSIMKNMQLTERQKKLAQHHFNQGKLPEYNVTAHLNELLIALQDNPSLLKLFVDIQYQAAHADGLTYKKIIALNEILQHLGLAPLDRQQRFYQDSSHYSGRQHSNQHRSSSSQQHQVPNSVLDNAFVTLGVSPTHSKQDVKKAYQRLISRHHPDKLIAKSASNDTIKIANEKTQTIRKAYEQICSAKGW